jgi:hypothetical protein
MRTRPQVLEQCSRLAVTDADTGTRRDRVLLCSGLEYRFLAGFDFDAIVLV